jgi:hypothetical protein
LTTLKTGLSILDNINQLVLLNMELRRGARPESSGYPFKIVVVLTLKTDFIFGVLE